MEIVDVNVLLYATNPDAPHHRESKAWLAEAMETPGALGLTWLVLVSFIRLSTHEAIWPEPLPAGEAIDIVDEWLRSPGAALVEPTSRHTPVLRGLLSETGTAGNLANDAHLAAIAVEHGAAICSFDNDFARFPGVQWHSPGRRRG